MSTTPRNFANGPRPPRRRPSPDEQLRHPRPVRNVRLKATLTDDPDPFRPRQQLGQLDSAFMSLEESTDDAPLSMAAIIASKLNRTEGWSSLRQQIADYQTRWHCERGQASDGDALRTRNACRLADLLAQLNRLVSVLDESRDPADSSSNTLLNSPTAMSIGVAVGIEIGRAETIVQYHRQIRLGARAQEKAAAGGRATRWGDHNRNFSNVLIANAMRRLARGDSMREACRPVADPKGESDPPSGKTIKSMVQRLIDSWIGQILGMWDGTESMLDSQCESIARSAAEKGLKVSSSGVKTIVVARMRRRPWKDLLSVARARAENAGSHQNKG
jgi:hypothetical protein